eukprot:6875318-Pyramimonas_sp.AAC.1
MLGIPMYLCTDTALPGELDAAAAAAKEDAAAAVAICSVCENDHATLIRVCARLRSARSLLCTDGSIRLTLAGAVAETVPGRPNARV